MPRMSDNRQISRARPRPLENKFCHFDWALSERAPRLIKVLENPRWSMKCHHRSQYLPCLSFPVLCSCTIFPRHVRKTPSWVLALPRTSSVGFSRTLEEAVLHQNQSKPNHHASTLSVPAKSGVFPTGVPARRLAKLLCSVS